MNLNLYRHALARLNLMRSRGAGSVAQSFTLVLLCANLALAQDAPRIGYVQTLPDFGAGYALTREGTSSAGRYIFYSPNPGIDEHYVNIDAQDYLVHEVSRRQETVRSTGVEREYDVLVFRPSTDIFEVELWLRYESDGFEGQNIFGGMSVRRGEQQTTTRVEGHAGP